MAKVENLQGWEESEFPIICETCLGKNPYIRMTRQGFGEMCKICDRPFTIFRWYPETKHRLKRTEICQICARMRNVCQTCVLDLQYELPVDVRDTALQLEGEVPTSDLNRQYFAQNTEASALGAAGLSMAGKVESAGRELLKKMARKDPYLMKDRAQYCTFHALSECQRGDKCPYKHELPKEDTEGNREFLERSDELQDPKTVHLVRKTRYLAGLVPPVDQSITSLFLTGLNDNIDEQDIRDQMYAYGEIKSVVVARKSQCAFVNYVTRAAAELAAEACHSGLMVRDVRLKVAWGKARPLGPNEDRNKGENGNIGEMVAPLPPGAARVKYPSQDPTLLGAAKR